MINLTREEAQQVLDALEYGIDYVKSEETTNKQTYKGYEHLCPDDSYYIKFIDDAMETLRARLSAPEPEQTAKHYGYLWYTHHMERRFTHYKPEAGQYFGSEPEPVYTAPPKREWQGLTQDELDEAIWAGDRYAVMAAIEAKLKEKNA